MKPFIIALLREHYSFEILKVRLLDLDTNKVVDTSFDKLTELVVNEPAKYRDTNFWFLGEDKEIRNAYLDYIQDILIEVDEENNTYNTVEELGMYTILSKYSNKDVYILSNAYGNVKEVEDGDLYSIYNSYGITNVFNGEKSVGCKLTGMANVVLYNVEHGDTEFEQYIKEEYKKFIDKTTLLGLDVSFQYMIEGEEVILIRYTGNYNNVYIPSFVTIIGQNAFSFYWNYDKIIPIKSISLSEGLKEIRELAFTYCRVQNITIPSTVKVIKRYAFYNSSICSSYFDESFQDGTGVIKFPISSDKITLLSKETIVEDELI